MFCLNSWKINQMRMVSKENCGCKIEGCIPKYLLEYVDMYFVLLFLNSFFPFSSADEPLKWQYVDQFVSDAGVRDQYFVKCLLKNL